MTLDWSSSPNGVRKLAYLVYRRAGPAAGTDCPAGADLAADGYVQIDARNDDTVAYTDTGLTAETRYCYRVAAAFGLQASNAVDATTSTDPAPVVTIVAPAGGTATVDEGAAVRLSVTATDVDGAGMQFTALTYAWTQTASASVTTAATTNVVTLAGENTPIVTFTAPEFNTDAETATLHFLVTVTGSGNGEGTARIAITVTGDNDEPTVTARSSTEAAQPATVITLTATANDPDHPDNAITYAWACTPAVDDAATLTAGDVTVALMNAAGDAAYASGTGGRIATFTAPPLMNADNPPKTATTITLTCTVMVTSGGDTAMDSVTITIANRRGDDAATDEAILPNVLRHQTHGIHGGIFQRIQQRQRADGKWK